MRQLVQVITCDTCKSEVSESELVMHTWHWDGEWYLTEMCTGCSAKADQRTLWELIDVSITTSAPKRSYVKTADYTRTPSSTGASFVEEIRQVVGESTQMLTSGQVAKKVNAARPKSVRTILARLASKGEITRLRRDGRSYLYHSNDLDMGTQRRPTASASPTAH